jgi:signal transduction histidine kinase/CheY-like chemotaxis protein
VTNEKNKKEAAAASSLSVLIRVEQIRIICNNMPSVLISNSLIPLLLLYALWDEPKRPMILIWVGLMLCLVALRAGLFVAYRLAAPSLPEIERWGTWLVGTSLASGCLWGAAGVLFAVPATNEHFSLIVLVLHAMGAAAVISYASYLPVFYAFFLPSLLPLAVTLFLGQEHTHFVIANTTLLYVIAVSFFAQNLHKVFTESLRLRFENIDLVKELMAQKETAERANIAKTRFLAAASHDLRQPLHAMGLFVSALSERVRGVVTRKLVLQLGASTEALRGLLNALLDISRLDAGVIQPRITHCSLQGLFDRLAHDYAAHAVEKNISLKFVSTIGWVRCDATLLERIVRNLVSNAICYTDCGSVLVGCRRRGECLRIEVWDSGIGIAADELNNIFHEFYQVGNPERDRGKGLGLGLAIAQRLARLLDHRIEVTSVPSRGSVFALTVPRSAVTGAESETPPPAAPSRLDSALVVVIDDELAIREATQIMLEGWGCEVVLADSGDAAMVAIAQTGRPPEAIIADYRLRNSKTGVEAIKGLHAKYGRDIPAIIITGDTAPDRLREAEGSGYHLLHKPLAPARLRALLSHVLSGP